MTFKCPDCDADIEILEDAENGDIYTCVSCGLELEYKDGELIPPTIEGEDWGE